MRGALPPWVSEADRVCVVGSPLGKTWDAARRLISEGQARFALFRKRRRLSEEAIGILLETARAGERDFPETLGGRAAADELLDAKYVEVFQPAQAGPVFTRRGGIQEAFEMQTYATRPRLITTADGAKRARRLSAEVVDYDG